MNDPFFPDEICEELCIFVYILPISFYPPLTLRRLAMTGETGKGEANGP
jgi:hypothetical protein